MKITAAGDRAILVELGEISAAELHRKAAEMRAQEGVAAVIPGHSSLYVIRGVGTHRTERQRLPVVHTIPVAFDGPDLDEFLSRIHLGREAFLSRVAGLRLVARYLGFRGGFAYLDGWPEEWAMQRRPTSRPVERGSFAIAGNVAGFYPIDTPGGWNILGKTHADLEYAIAAGDEIVIEPTNRTAGVSPATPRHPAAANPWPQRQARRPSPAGETPAVLADILAAPLSVVVGARDWSNLEHGRPAGGPFDTDLARVANRSVGNDEDAPLLECALVGPHARASHMAWATLEGVAVHHGEIKAGRIHGRGYLAAGSSEQPVEMPRREGDRLTIRTMSGPHEPGLEEIVCEVTRHLDRVGIRLRPLQPVGIHGPADMKSVGMQFGSVQLHPDGSLVAMGPDHPVTGGYLQPMTVLSSELWKLAHLAPGDRVHFTTHWP